MGQSVAPRARWRKHKYLAINGKTNQYIHAAMNKHGIENFKFEIIAKFDSRKEVDQAEFDFIKAFRAREKEFGYNIKPGGFNKGNWNHSEETIEKLKDNWSEIHTPESIEKTRQGNLGKKLSEEHIEAIRRANIGNKRLVGYKQPQEQIDKRRETQAANYGNKVCEADGCERTDGHRIDGKRYCSMHGQRLRKTGTLEKIKRPSPSKGIARSAETRAKLSAALKGRKAPNRIEFTQEQIDYIMSYSISSEALAEKYGVSRNVIKRVRRENKVK